MFKLVVGILVNWHISTHVCWNVSIYVVYIPGFFFQEIPTAMRIGQKPTFCVTPNYLIWKYLIRKELSYTMKIHSTWTFSVMHKVLIRIKLSVLVPIKSIGKVKLQTKSCFIQQDSEPDFRTWIPCFCIALYLLHNLCADGCFI